MAKRKKKLDEGMIMVSSLLPVNRIDSLTRKYNDNFEFKGLPGQFNEAGEKIMDDQGNDIEEDFIKEDFDNNQLKKANKDFDELQDIILRFEKIKTSVKKYSKSTWAKLQKANIALSDARDYFMDDMSGFGD